MLQVSVEHQFEIVYWDDWLLAEVVLLQVEYQLRLIGEILVHFFKPGLEALVDIFKFPLTPLVRGTRQRREGLLDI